MTTDYSKFTEAELTTRDTQPAIHMHWVWDETAGETSMETGRWVWDTDADIKAQRQAAGLLALDLATIEMQSLRAMREVLIALIQRGDVVTPSPATAQLVKLDAEIKTRRQAG